MKLKVQLSGCREACREGMATIGRSWLIHYSTRTALVTVADELVLIGYLNGG
jgi:hypothetical protein